MSSDQSESDPPIRPSKERRLAQLLEDTQALRELVGKLVSVVPDSGGTDVFAAGAAATPLWRTEALKLAPEDLRPRLELWLDEVKYAVPKSAQKQNTPFNKFRLGLASMGLIIPTDPATGMISSIPETPEPVDGFVVSIDIRKSTELMAHAISPESFARFMNEFITNVKGLVDDCHGFWDKFTGDGALAFFPKAACDQPRQVLENVLMLARMIHRRFERIYSASDWRFHNPPVTGVGVGIGYGTVGVRDVGERLTVVGQAVVDACRLCSCPANETFVNTRSLEVVDRELLAVVDDESMLARLEIGKSSPPFALVRHQCEVKGRGFVRCLRLATRYLPYEPNPPVWRLD